MVNVLIVGRTGVGKSTLVNALFAAELAPTGQGRPVTRSVKEFAGDSIGVTLVDTRGFELSGFAVMRDGIRQLMETRSATTSDRFHVGWLCIPEDSRRVEMAENELAAVVAAHCPLVGVITKARDDDGFQIVVQSLLPEAKRVVRVRAIPEELDDGHKLPQMGLVELLQETAGLVAASQSVSLKTLAKRLTVVD